MSEKDKIFSGKIQHRGIFDFKEFYNFCYKWFTDEDYSLTEKAYKEKVTPKGKEIEIEWQAIRKISDYFRFVVKSKWRILGMTDVEVQENGKKIHMNKGQVGINVSAVLEKDYENRWEGTAFMKFLRGVYDRYIILGRIDAYEDKLFSEVDEFLGQAKSFLALEGRH